MAEFGTKSDSGNAAFSLRQGGFAPLADFAEQSSGAHAAGRKAAASEWSQSLRAIRLALRRNVALLVGVVSGLILLLLLVFVLRWALERDAWQVRSISVMPEQKLRLYQPEVLEEQARAWLEAQTMRCSLVYCDTDSLKDYLESLPWIRKVVVRKHYPDGLRLQVEEHQARAYWGVAGDAQVMNQYGEIFNARWEDVRPRNLPVLFSEQSGALEDDKQTKRTSVEDAVQAPRGGISPAQLYRIWQRWDALVWPLKLRITELRQNSFGSWNVVLSNGATIALGQGEEAALEEKLKNFVATIEATSKTYAGSVEDVLVSADLRYPNGYAVRLKGVQTSAVPSGSPRSRAVQR